MISPGSFNARKRVEAAQIRLDVITEGAQRLWILFEMISALKEGKCSKGLANKSWQKVKPLPN